MKIDDYAFFHEATLNICGSLELKAVFKNCFLFLKQYIPINSIDCNLFDLETGGFKFIAFASDFELKIPLNQTRFLSKKAQAELKSDIGKPYLIDIDGRKTITREIAQTTGYKTASGIGIPLQIEGDQMVVIGMMTKEKNVFSQKHLRLIHMLRDPFSIAISNHLRYQQVVKLKTILQDDKQYLQKELHRISGDVIIGEQSGLRYVMEMVRQVASLDNHVLLLGETGVGKEVIANTLHYSSDRRKGPFIKINCGAIPETLIDSELFGHEKGAFTGAMAMKRGLFERADKGSVFLDEVGELPAAAQIRLLRVLQEKTIERVGGTENQTLDVRVIAATHRNLGEMVKNGYFREDLWYRLNVFPIIIPPLRQRKADIPGFVDYFIDLKTRELNLGQRPVVTSETIDRLTEYDWPGNVRELENFIERSLILSRTGRFEGRLHFDDRHLLNSTLPSPRQLGSHDPEVLDLEDINRRHILHVLQLTKGKVQGKNGAADLLGINPGTLRSRMRKLQIPFGRKKDMISAD
ncbi:sigma 54-interacting transcriptional regulator [Desulfobacula sp.]|uniref:sigma-54 interaction domain-containing protein n=1 Tax=Desulfobacula sp. TaxID=2593537 RepID=UPI0026245FDA|nr:sigma 54-interacting transcriptional regulator [Desulfobacula sp.]